MKATGLSSGSGICGLRSSGREHEEDMALGTSYATSFCPRPNRPTMISAKYRQKEERRKVLKISINKLKKIEDPESSLRRSVLINNTMKRLQKEAREEKMQKQDRLCIKEDQQLADITNLPKKEEEGRKRSLEEEDVQAVLSQFYMPLTPRMLTSIDEDEEEEIVNVVDVDGEPSGKKPRLEPVSAAERLAESERANLYCLEQAESKRTSRLEGLEVESERSALYCMEDCEAKRTRLGEPLSESERSPVYCLEQPETKRPRLDDPIRPPLFCPGLPRQDETDTDRLPVYCLDQKRPDETNDRLSPLYSLTDQVPDKRTSCEQPQERPATPLYCLQEEPKRTPHDPPPFSCGHSSIFTELQSVVYHSLIASLET